MRLRSLFTALAALVVPIGILPAQAIAAPAKTYYVAADGSGPACSVQVPCDLLTARAKVRQVLAEGMERDIRIELADGTYRTPLALGPEDSGRDSRSVSWAAAPGASPVFDGGTAMTGWAPAADGRWVATVPAGVTPRQLFVNGVRAIRARGEQCLASTCDATKPGMTGAIATGISKWSRPTDAEAVIRIRWRNYHCRIAGVNGDQLTFVQPCWQNSAGGTDRTGPFWDSTTVDSTRYTKVSFFENAIELLDTPGEFVWNSADRTVTYLPRPGENLRTAAVITPVTETLLSLDGARNVVVDGLTFAHAAYHQPGSGEGYAGTQAGLTLTGATGPKDHAGRYYTKPSAAVVVRAGRGVTLTGLTFEHLGGAGVVLEAGTQDTTVTRSTFTDLSSGGVYVGDTEPNPAPELAGLRNTVSYNTIRRIGVEYTDAVGVWAGYEAELTVDHNTLTELPYSGISVGWGWNQPEARTPVLRDNAITNNRIVDAMMTEFDQHDGGAIYTQGPQPGTVISGNYLNRSAYGNNERDGNGVYLDEQSSYIRVERNVITRIGYKWVSNWAGYGIENVASGNWTDTDAPALSGRGSRMVDNATKLDTLPPEAVAVATAAGATPGSVEQLRVDLARTGTATQSSTAGAAAAAAAIDGNTSTDSATLAATGSWWQVDLGRSQRIGQIEIWNDAAMRSTDFDVVVSDDADFANATRHRVNGKALRPTLLDLATTGRYVRIQLTGTGRVGLAAVLVHPGASSVARTSTIAEDQAHTFEIQALPSARTTELDRNQIALSNTDLRSTGFYLPANTALNVVVHKDSMAPTLVVGAPDADARKEYRAPRQYSLKVGRNTITDPGGGVVYLKLVGDEGSAKVSLGDSVQPMPYFTLGSTSEAEFQAQLDQRITPYVELVGPHTMITVERSSALKFRAEDHAALLSTYEDIIAIEDAVSGYDGSSPLHARQAHPYHFVGFPAAIPGVGAYATHGHMSFPPPIQDRMLTVTGLRTRGWGVYHELGHQHQQINYKPTSLTEVTVNIYSLAVNAAFATKYGQQPRLHQPDAKTGLTPWQSAPPKLRRPDVEYGKTFDAYERLVMFEQLRLAFGNDYWPRLHKLVRADRPYAGHYADETLRLRNLAVWFSKAAGHDLTDFLRAWGLPVDAEAAAQIAALRLTPPPVDPTTLHDQPPTGTTPR